MSSHSAQAANRRETNPRPQAWRVVIDVEAGKGFNVAAAAFRHPLARHRTDGVAAARCSCGEAGFVHFAHLDLYKTRRVSEHRSFSL